MPFLEPIVLLTLQLLGSRLLSNGFMIGYFGITWDNLLLWRYHPLSFFIDVIAIGGFLFCLIRGNQLVPDEKQKHVAAVSVAIFLTVTMFLFGGRLLNRTTDLIHDGAVQTEIAAQFLLQGKNPYDASYAGTTFEHFQQPNFDDAVNPVLDHYPYPPLLPVLTVPLAWLSSVTGWPLESRWILLLALVIGCALIIRRAMTVSDRTWLIVLTIGNPFIIFFPLIGFNDALFVALVLGAVWLIEKQRWWWAGAVFGLVLAAKQTVWLFVPLWLIWLWRQSSTDRRRFWQSLGWTGLTAAALFGPFILWNGPAFFDDVVKFVAGAVPHTFPVSGASLWQLLVIEQFVDTPWITNSATLLQLAAAALLYPLSLRRLWREPSAGQFLILAVGLTFVFGLLNRYFYDNYLSALLLLAVASYAFRLPMTADQKPDGG